MSQRGEDWQRREVLRVSLNNRTKKRKNVLACCLYCKKIGFRTPLRLQQTQQYETRVRRSSRSRVYRQQVIIASSLVSFPGYSLQHSVETLGRSGLNGLRTISVLNNKYLNSQSLVHIPSPSIPLLRLVCTSLQEALRQTPLVFHSH